MKYQQIVLIEITIEEAKPSIPKKKVLKAIKTLVFTPVLRIRVVRVKRKGNHLSINIKN